MQTEFYQIAKGMTTITEKCVLDSERDCPVSKRTDETVSDIKALDKRFTDFQHAVSETNGRFGSRIGKLEAHNEVQDEQMRQIKETQAEIKRDIASARSEQKDSIAELRRDNKVSMDDLKRSTKESMDDLKRSTKEILDAVTPMKHKIESLESLREDVTELKEKPGKTWEDIKSKALGWVIALILAILAAALGLSKFL